jgi:FkbM family methyltransferase
MNPITKIPPEILAAARDPARWPSLPREILGRVWRRDWRVLGGALALRGNIARLDGCVFDLSDPGISLQLKSRFVTDAYERAERTLIERHLPRDRPVLELGACLGVLACIVNRRLAHRSHHVVVEPNPALIPILERNRELNRAAFTIEHGAIWYGASDATLMIHPVLATSSSLTSSVGEPRTVPALSLTTLVERYQLHRAALILDIEGTECDLIRKEGRVLADNIEILIMELHPRIYGEDEAESIRVALRVLEFECVDSIRDVEVWRKRRA